VHSPQWVVFGPGFHSKNWAATLFFFSSSSKESGKAFAVSSKKKLQNKVFGCLQHPFREMQATLIKSD
jgi:hypothetical protein